MNQAFLRYINNRIRETRPLLATSEVCKIFQTNDLIEIGFISRQCKNDLSGSCLMCDYGKAEGTYEEQIYLDEMDKVLQKSSTDIQFLLLCCNGSILDEYQISTSLLSEILKKAQSSSIPNIIIETHYLDVTQDRLSLIKSIMKKPLIIEMGLETINPKFHEILFMKKIDLNLYETKIKLIQNYGYKVELNIMLGLPFLNTKQQLEDTEKTVKWAIDHKCDPIVFPINVKPHTMLRFAYDNGFYKPISLWLLILLLNRMSKPELEKSLIAWYGNRDEPYEDDLPTLMPTACNSCRKKLGQFFENFLNVNQYELRKSLLDNLMQDVSCECFARLKRELKVDCTSFDVEFSKFFAYLKTKFTV